MWGNKRSSSRLPWLQAIFMTSMPNLMNDQKQVKNCACLLDHYYLKVKFEHCFLYNDLLAYLTLVVYIADSFIHPFQKLCV